MRHAQDVVDALEPKQRKLLNQIWAAVVTAHNAESYFEEKAERTKDIHMAADYLAAAASCSKILHKLRDLAEEEFGIELDV